MIAHIRITAMWFDRACRRSRFAVRCAAWCLLRWRIATMIANLYTMIANHWGLSIVAGMGHGGSAEGHNGESAK